MCTEEYLMLGQVPPDQEATSNTANRDKEEILTTKDLKWSPLIVQSSLGNYGLKIGVFSYIRTLCFEHEAYSSKMLT